MKTLSVDDVKWEVIADYEHIPVRGNAISTGDDDEDKSHEDWIIERLDSGDVWAWAMVTVRGRWNGLSAETYLGCCCYKDELDFRAPGGYFQDMQAEVLDELQAQAEDIAASMK